MANLGDNAGLGANIAAVATSTLILDPPSCDADASSGAIELIRKKRREMRAARHRTKN